MPNLTLDVRHPDLIDCSFMFSIAEGDNYPNETPEFGVFTNPYLHPRFISKNYATKDVAQTARIKLFSRNSPSVNADGRIYLQGAFAEFNKKPYVFLTKHLFYWLAADMPLPQKMQLLAAEFNIAIQLMELAK